ncbi:MAG: hypothetical protein AMXMBFR13_35400 [Phycisphaerae bacterium]
MRLSQIVGVAAGLLAMPLASLGANFAPGNLVVSQVSQGNPGVGLSSDDSAGQVTLLEFDLTPGSPAVQSIPLPTVASGQNRALTISSAGFREGHLTRSTDGRFLTIGGYDAAVGTAGVAETDPAQINRVIGRIGVNGSVDTSTAFGDAYGFSAGAFRSVASTDGLNFWTTGNAGSSSAAVTRYVAYGATTSQRLHSTSRTKNTRVANIFDGQLYHSSNSGEKGVVQVGTGTPTTGNSNPHTVIPGFDFAPDSDGSPYDFHMFDLNPNVAGMDTLYLTDDGYVGAGNTIGGGLAKYTFDGTNWNFDYIMRAGLEEGVQALRGLTGVVDNGQVVLYGITGKDSGDNQLVAITDTGANSAFSVLQTAPAGTIFRGVDFAPIPEPASLALVALGGMLVLRRRRF